MDNSFYFKHDQNARSNDKITALIFKWGWSGYGLYWAIIEKLYENDGILELEYERIAFDLRTDNVCIESIISDFNLFEIKGNVFTSKRVRISLNERKSKSEKARKSVEARWSKGKKGDTNVLRSQYDSNTKEERRGEERKEEERTIKRVGFKVPLIADVIREFEDKRFDQSEAKAFFDFYECKGWMVGKNKMKDWKAAVRNWVRDKTPKPKPREFIKPLQI